MEYSIRTNALNKQYHGHWAVRDMSIHVPKGEIYGLLGRNGAGKTTIMKILLGLVKKTSGSVFLFDQEMSGYRYEIYSRIGSTIEAPGFYPNLTASENLSVFARLRGKVRAERLRAALDLTGLPYRDKKAFSKYSLGMKQRLAVACAIMNDPDLLILDEPSNGLDPIGIAQMRSLLQRLSRDNGKTILISSHQLSEIEQLADQIGIIQEGRLLEECSCRKLAEKEHPYIRLNTNRPEQVWEYLKTSLHIGSCTLTGSSIIEIYDLQYDTLEINRRLSAAGFDVIEISMCRSNLETYFKELTGGVGIA